MRSTTNGLGAAIFGAPSTTAREVALAILRIVVGVVFIAHGARGVRGRS